MRSHSEQVQREMERQRIVDAAVEAADSIIRGGFDGSVEEADYLTAQVARKFMEKIDMAVTAKLRRRELGFDPDQHFAIFSRLIGEVIGICTLQGKLEEERSEPSSIFVPITKEQFDKYGDGPDEWRQLAQIGLENPKH